MIILVPKWAHHYEEFWLAVRRRNLWFIRLRYFFILLLLIFLTGGQFILGFDLTATQITAILTIALFILCYNVIIQITRRNISCIPGEFNCMHLSLIQMILDLTTLLVLVYFTGIVESPLYVFFIFQVIVGSLILPGYVIYSVSALIIGAYSSLIILQYIGYVPTHLINGIYHSYHPHPLSYNLLFITMFAAMMLISVLIANRIARSLYKREQQLRETVDKLNEIETAKQKYIIGVVHEIKSPIAAVQSIIDIIINDYLGPVNDEVKTKLKKARLRSEEAIQLVNNILRLSKLKLLNITSSEELDLLGIIEKIKDQHAEELRTDNISFVIDNKTGKDISFYSDKVLFELALSNIIKNAIKYNLPEGSVVVRLEKVNTHFTLEVMDDGIGIPAEESTRVFQQFYRATNVRKKKTEGSGLGLALVKEIIERLGGKIQLESPSEISRPGRPGTTIRIILSEVAKPENIESANKTDDTLVKEI